MSNDSISLTLGIDYDSIESGTILMVSAFGSEDEDIRVEVIKENTIITIDSDEVKAYLVEMENGHQFMIGDGEIVSIVEEEDEEEAEPVNDKEITMEWS